MRRESKRQISAVVPEGLKEWYERRAAEQGVSLSQLIREILQAKRAAVTGKQRDDY